MRSDVGITCPLSQAQWSWWLAQQLHPDVPATVAMYLDLAGEADLDLLVRCTRRAAAELESPQVRFTLVDGVPHQFVDPTAPFPFDIVDLTTLPDPVAVALDHMERDHSAPLDPLSPLLTVASLFTIAPTRHLLYLRSHHIVLDGVGAAALLTRTGDLYRAASPERQVSASASSMPRATARHEPEPSDGAAKHTTAQRGRAAEASRGPLTVAQLLDEDRAYRSSSRAASDREYWRQQLTGVGEPVSLTRRVAAPATRPHQVSTTLDAGAVRLLTEAKARHGATFPELVIAAFGCYLARMTGSAEVTLTIPVTARPTAVLRRSAGSMSNVVPLRLSGLDDITVGAVIAQVRAAVIGALRHQRHRHEDIRADHPTLREGFGPVVNTLAFTEPLHLGPLSGQVRLLALGPVTDLHVNGVQIGPDEVSIDFQANPARYSHDAVLTHHHTFLTYFTHFLTAHPHDPITIDDPAADSAMRSPNRVFPKAIRPNTPTRTLPELLRSALSTTDNPAAAPVRQRLGPGPATTDRSSSDRAPRSPHAPPEPTRRSRDTAGDRATREAAYSSVALQDRDRTLTYSELDENSSRWARALLARGVGPGTFVVVAIPRSLESVVALWAVAKTGACFVPVDPDEPANRLSTVVARCGAPVGVTVSWVSVGCDAITWLAIDDPAEANRYSGTPVGDHDRPRPLLPGDPAYVIHTSGTTGTPKGVVVAHHALGYLTDYLLKQYGLDRDSVLLHSHSATYDAHLLELLAGFAAGARVVVAPPTVVAGQEMAELIRTTGCTVFQTAPAVLATLSPQQLPAVEVVAIGGEVCPAALMAEWAPQVRLFNGYGPTETTIMVTETDAMRPGGAVTVGQPLPGVSTWVLDTRLRQTPVTARGELYVGGACVADGYLNDPAATASRFVADPFGDGSRLYRTGDLVCARPDGEFEFFGRLDAQLEVNGRRIEPAEIEAVLLSEPEIAYAVVTAADAGTPGARLIGYVVPVPGKHVDAAAVLARSRAALPQALVPSMLIEIDRLPLGGNGKVVRSDLPAPTITANPTRPPTTELQRLIADRITTTLGTPVGLDDDFFELGGNSLLGVLVSSDIAAATGVPVTVRWLYTAPTVAALAERIATFDGHSDDDALGTVLVLRRKGSRPPLFCVHSAVPLAWCYAGLTGYLPDRPVYGLQATELTGTPTIDDLVEHYLAAVLERQPRGPYHLLGWSLGGQIAHALAVRLRDTGARVGVLTMLDSVVFTPEEPPTPRMRDLLTHLLGDEPEDADAAPEVTAAEAAAILASTKTSFGTGLSASQLERLHRGYIAGVRLSHTYRPARFDGDLLYFSATRGITAMFDGDMWQPFLTGEVIEHPVEATHAQLTNTSVFAHIGPLLAHHLDRVEEPSEPALATTAAEEPW
ncbi:enterobactin synthetase component F [Nocardia caishijiensis]|uniref:Enterobactin synthetase component F n=1 Tax=Nocardia caishijiensis TaxID=184756 RepID=A0ABQ6YNL6_9NOCA|nr:enterobactin synthetase component F [Nocardia caishijiensis]